jgi:hypothetical protein
LHISLDHSHRKVWGFIRYNTTRLGTQKGDSGKDSNLFDEPFSAGRSSAIPSIKDRERDGSLSEVKRGIAFALDPSRWEVMSGAQMLRHRRAKIPKNSRHFSHDSSRTESPIFLGWKWPRTNSDSADEGVVRWPATHDMEDWDMKLRYLIVDEAGQLVRVRRSLVQALWDGEAPAEALGSVSPNELRLVSVIADSRLLPRRIYLLRLPLSAGQFRKENYLTLKIFSRSDCVTPKEVVRHHTDGWPKDFFEQLAVALDVTRKQLNVPLGIGGPLLMAAAMSVTPKQALRYLK